MNTPSSCPTPHPSTRQRTPWLLPALLLAVLFWLAGAALPASAATRPREGAQRQQRTAVGKSAQLNFTPVITATKSDAFPGAEAEPGETISYTVVVGNSGSSSATDVTLSDVIDLHTTFVSGSLRVTPLAAGDAYAAIGNTRMAITATNGLLANDVDPDDPAPNPAFNEGLIIVLSDTTSANGGAVSVSADGAFTYDPPAGFEGSDTFSYTVEDGHGLRDTGTVTVTVSDVIWYVDNTADPGGDGRSHSPFDSVAAFNSTAADDPGDVIFLYEQGGGAYDNGLTLLDDQQLIGQGVDLVTAAGLTPPLGSTFPGVTANPTLNNTTADNGGNGMVLAQDNAIHGLDLGITGGAGISGSNFGTLTANTVSVTGSGAILSLATGTLSATFDALSTTSSATTGVSLTGVDGSLTAGSGSIAGATGTAFDVKGGTASITYPGAINQSAAARIVQVQNRSAGAGTMTFSGSLSCDSNCTGINVANNGGGAVTFNGGSKTLNTGANTAVSLSGNSGATINFTGGRLDIDTTTATGFIAGGGGTLNVTGSGNTINAASTALNINGTAMGTNGVTFERIDVDQSASGSDTTAIILTNTGSGAFTVTGDGTTTFGGNGSGGTIQNLTDADAITLNNTGGRVTLQNMIVEDIGDSGDNSDAINTRSFRDAIHGENVNGGLTLQSVTIRRTSDHAILGALFSDGTGLTTWNGLELYDSLFENANRFHVTDRGDDVDEGVIRIRGLTGTMIVDNSTFRDGARGLDISTPPGSGTLDATIQRSTFEDLYKEFSSGGTTNAGLRGISFEARGAHDMVVRIGDPDEASAALGNTFSNNLTASIVIFGQEGGTDPHVGDVDAVISQNTFVVTDHSSPQSTPPDFSSFNFPQGGVSLNPSGGTFEAIVSNNLFDEVMHAAGGFGQLTIGHNTGNGVSEFIVRGNEFRKPWDMALQLRAEGNQSMAILLEDNVWTEGLVGGTGTDFEGGDCGTGDPTGFCPAPFQGVRVNVRNDGSMDLTVRNEVLPQHDDVNDGAFTFVAEVQAQADNVLNLYLDDNKAPDGYRLIQSAGAFNLFRENSADVTAAEIIDGNGNTGGNGTVAGDPDTNGDDTDPPVVSTSGTINPTDTAPTLPAINIPLSSAPSNNVTIAASDPLRLDNFASTPPTNTTPELTILPRNPAFHQLRAALLPPAATPGDTLALLNDPFTLPAGESFTATFAVSITAPLPAGVNSVQNQATVSGSNFDDVLSADPDPNPGLPPANGETLTPVNAAPDLSLAKDDGGLIAAAGDTVTYTLTYSNTGTQHASGVVLTETVPAHTTFNPGASTAGWSCAPDNDAGSTCTLPAGNVDAGDPPATAAFAVDVATAVPAGTTQIDNTAQVGDDGSGGSDPTPADNTAPDTTPLLTADLVVAKSDTPEPVAAGETLTYTVTITNNGPAGAQNVVATDTLTDVLTLTGTTGCAEDPNGAPTCSLGTIAAGSTATYTLSALLDSATLAQTITNTVSVTSTTVEGAPGDESATITSTVNIVADLQLTKTDSPDPVVAGNPLTYTLTITNHGPSQGWGVKVDDSLPLAYNHTGNSCGVFYAPPNPFEWVINDMPPGTVLTCVITGTVDPGVGGTITNTAFANTIAFVTDPDPGNDSVDEPTTVAEDVFSIDDVSQAEGDVGVSPFTFTVSRANNAAAASVDVATNPGTATPGVDYTPLPTTTVSFAAGGSLTQTVTVDVAGDTLVEDDETFFVNLSNPSIGVVGDGQGAGTIRNDDAATVDFDQATYSVAEDGGPAVVTVSLSAPSIHTATVHVATSEGTASAGADYTPVGEPLTFPAGQTAVTVTVPIVDDGLNEDNETLTLSLSDAVNATLGSANNPATLTIFDDEEETTTAFLPLALHGHVTLPDLLVRDLRVEDDGLTVVIANEGRRPVVDAFWVDVYVDPDPSPTAVNQTWPLLSDEGLVWGVEGPALPLQVGQALTLTVGDAYYVPAASNFSGALAPGTPLYAQVDSANAGVAYGAVLETHEAAGGSYNNVFGPLAAPAGGDLPSTDESPAGDMPRTLPPRLE